MNQITANLILLFITTLLASIFYWQIAHKILVRHVLCRLLARRDNLHRLAKDGIGDGSGLAYKGVEEFICKTISVVPSISLVSFLCFAVRNDEARSKSAELEEKSSPKLLDFLEKTTRDALIIMFLNSPILFFLGFSASTLLWIIDRFDKSIVYRHTKSFVEELPSDGTPLHPCCPSDSLA